MPVYSFPARRPRAIQRGLATTLDQEVHSGADVIAVSGGTFSLIAPDGTAVVDAQAVTVNAAGVATYALGASLLDDYDFGDAWLELWALEVSGAGIGTYQRGASLVRRLIYPVIVDQDLLDYHDDLTALAPDGQTSWENKRLQAWYDIEHWLMQSGLRPWLIMDGRVLRQAHIHRTLYHIYKSFAGMARGSTTNYPDARDHYLGLYQDDLSGLNLERYDYRKTGRAEDAAEAVQATSVVYGAYMPGGR